MSAQAKKLFAEALGTALLVFFACGVAALTFGYGLTEGSISAGVVATSLAFGLVLLALAYSLGPISGCHVNPAVTMGFLVSKRFTVQEAVQYWVAQAVGGIVGAAGLYGMLSQADGYDVKVQGLGANGFGDSSMIQLSAAGGFIAEVILTFLFVYVILAVTGPMASAPAVAGVAIGLTLVIVHLIGIPLTGTSVNPARSLGPALFVGDDALEQVWLFIVAPLVGGGLAAVVHEMLAPAEGTSTAA